MSLALALWLILGIGVLGYLAGHGRGRIRGRHEMARLVEAKYGPLLAQLEAFAAESIHSLAAELSAEEKEQIDERLEAMRKASPFN